MLSIFDDERRVPGAIWPNRFGTWLIWPMDVVAKSLECWALPRFPRLAIGQTSHAGTTTIIVHRP